MMEELIRFAERYSTPESSLLRKLNRETHLTQLYPRMLADHIQGGFLKFIARMIKPRYTLEIGTFTGYSALCLAEGGGMVHTIEVNPEQELIIRKYIREAGLEERIILHIGDARQVIDRLEMTWDLIYLDADKTGYQNYYQQLIDKLRPGGWLLADNVFWSGKVLLPEEKQDKEARAITGFINFVNADPRVETLILPIRDGIMMINKKQSDDNP